MNERPNTEDTEQTVGEAAEDLTRSVTELVGAAFGVGAAVAKSVAQATSSGRPLSTPAGPQGPVGEMIHYGLTAASNIVRIAVSAAPRPATGETAVAPDSKAPSGPSVTAGATLRIPLSIENPSAAPMPSLEFRCLRVESPQTGAGMHLGVANVRFDPPVLTIAPRDFEKMIVFIDTLPATALGSYRAIIGVADGSFESAVQFEVLAPQA